MPGQRGRPREHPAARCPDPEHQGSHVVANGSRRSGTTEKRRYVCSPLTGKQHTFTVVIRDETPVPITPALDLPVCPEHPNGHVVRNGTYCQAAESAAQ